MSVIFSRNGVLLGTGSGGGSGSYVAGQNINIADGIISTEDVVYFNASEGQGIKIESVDGSFSASMEIGKDGQGDKLVLHSADGSIINDFIISSSGLQIGDTVLNANDLTINGNSFSSVVSTVDLHTEQIAELSGAISDYHEYSGIGPVTVDNENDTISVDLTSKQDTLIPGSHIAITDNVISVSGELGKVYSGNNPIVVDNVNDTISFDDTGFVKSNDMSGYYTKSETYSQDEVDSKLAVFHNTEVSSTNGTVTINKTVEQDGTVKFDLAVAGGTGGDTSVQGIAPISAALVGDNTYQISIDDSNYATKDDLEDKQDKLSAGEHIAITDNVISVSGNFYTGSGAIIVDNDNGKIGIDDSNYATKSELSGKQDTLEFGYNSNGEIIRIDDHAIVDTTYVGISPISIVGNSISFNDSDYATKVWTNGQIASAVSGKQDKLTNEQLSAISSVSGKVDTSEYSEFKEYVTDELSDIDYDVAVLKLDVSALSANKQDKLTAGANIDITNNIVSGKDWSTEIQSATSGKQATLSAGANINITNNVISGKSWQNEIDTGLAFKQDKLVAGSGIMISGNTISTSGNFGHTYAGIAPINVNNATETISASTKELVAGQGIAISESSSAITISTSGSQGAGTQFYHGTDESQYETPISIATINHYGITQIYDQDDFPIDTYALPKAPTSADNGRVLGVVNETPVWVDNPQMVKTTKSDYIESNTYLKDSTWLDVVPGCTKIFGSVCVSQSSSGPWSVVPLDENDNLVCGACCTNLSGIPIGQQFISFLFKTDVPGQIRRIGLKGNNPTKVGNLTHVMAIGW